MHTVAELHFNASQYSFFCAGVLVLPHIRRGLLDRYAWRHADCFSREFGLQRGAFLNAWEIQCGGHIISIATWNSLSCCRLWSMLDFVSCFKLQWLEFLSFHLDFKVLLVPARKLPQNDSCRRLRLFASLYCWQCCYCLLQVLSAAGNDGSGYWDAARVLSLMASVAIGTFAAKEFKVREWGWWQWRGEEETMLKVEVLLGMPSMTIVFLYF